MILSKDSWPSVPSEVKDLDEEWGGHSYHKIIWYEEKLQKVTAIISNSVCLSNNTSQTLGDSMDKNRNVVKEVHW